MANARDFKTDITVNGVDVLLELPTKELLAIIIALLDRQNELLIAIGRPKGIDARG